MTELDMLIRAESYIRKMANGINPITGEMPLMTIWSTISA